MPLDQTPPPGSFAPTDGSVVLLQCVLNQIDHGILVLRRDGSVVVANQVALHECGEHPALQWQGQRLVAKTRVEADRLQRALVAASHGTRTLLVFGARQKTVAQDEPTQPTLLPLVVVPLQATYGAGPSNESLVLVLLAKRHGSEPLNVDLFAQAHQLTGAECTVLKGLSAGLAPADVARQQGVALSTLRSQIGSIRSKTQTRSIREMLGLVHNLPPVVSALSPLSPLSRFSALLAPAQVTEHEPTKKLPAATGRRPARGGQGVGAVRVPAAKALESQLN